MLTHPTSDRLEALVYHRVSRLFQALAIAMGDGRHARVLKSIGRTDLLVLDDWGLSVLTTAERRDLLEILENRQGAGSTIVTSQLPVDQWFEAIGAQLSQMPSLIGSFTCPSPQPQRRKYAKTDKPHQTT